MPGFYAMPMIDILAGGTLFFLILERSMQKKTFFVHVPQNILIVGFFFAILMSHIAHTYFAALIEAFTEFSSTLILFFLMLNVIDSRKKFIITVWLIIFLVVILVPQGMYQLQHGYGWAGQPITYDYHRDEYRINWIGIFNDPNDLALTFVIAIGFLIALLLGQTGFLTRLIALPFIGLLLYGIFLTNSRGGLLALIVTVYFYFVKRTNKLFWGSLIGGTLGFVVFTFGPSRAALFNIEEASAFNRIELWYQGILMMKANPLFGIGFKRFAQEMPHTAHNSEILARSELGILGLFYWKALIYISFKGLSIIQARDAELKTYALGLQSALVGFCAAAFFLSRTYIILPYLLFALSGSYMDIAKQRNPELDFHFTKKDFKNTWIFSFFMILIAYVMIKIAL